MDHLPRAVSLVSETGHLSWPRSSGWLADAPQLGGQPRSQFPRRWVRIPFSSELEELSPSAWEFPEFSPKSILRFQATIPLSRELQVGTDRIKTC